MRIVAGILRWYVPFEFRNRAKNKYAKTNVCHYISSEPLNRISWNIVGWVVFLCFAGPYKSHSEKVLLLSKSSYLFPDINQTNKAFIDDVIVKIHYIFTHVLFNHRIKYRVLITIFDITEHKCCPISTLKYINKNQNSKHIFIYNYLLSFL